MSKVLTFSRTFPAYHPKKGQQTHFVEKIWKSLQGIGYSEPHYFFKDYPGLEDLISHDSCEPKHHTIRGARNWEAGDVFSPRVWSGKPYASKQIIIGPDIKIKRTVDIEINFKNTSPTIIIDKICIDYDKGKMLSKNDGLTFLDFISWFKDPFIGQILIWNDCDFPY